MPPQQPKRATNREPDKSASRTTRSRVCKAFTTSGSPCKRQAVPGLTVCKSHGGGTAASVRAGKKARVSQRVAVLWGISPDTGAVSVEDELNSLARNKITDILALRIAIGENPRKHYGLLLDSKEVTEAEVAEDVFTTVKTKKSAGVHPLVNELHKAEQELVQILRLLQEVTGGSEEMDVKRIRLQTAREAARLIKAFPGISVDEVAAEVSKRA